MWGPYPTWVDSKVEGGRKVPVVQAGWGSRYMGHITLQLKPKGAPQVQAAGGPSDKAGSGGGGKGGVSSFQGYPILLGGSRSSNPMPEDPYIKEEIKKWRYW